MNSGLGQELQNNEKNGKAVASLVLTEATIFLHGAELRGYIELDLPAGESEVICNNISQQVVDNTLLVAASNGVLVLSAAIQYDYLDEGGKGGLPPQVQKIKDDLRTAQIAREKLQIQVAAIGEELAVMKANRQLAQEGQKISVTELAQMMDFVAQRTDHVLNKQAKAKLDIRDLDERIQKLEQQLEIENANGQTAVTCLAVRLFTPQAVAARIDISYVINDAGWEPAYDLHVVKMGEPIHMTYKARIFQNTGVNWEHVQLTLSSGKPTQGAQRPVLFPWYVDVERTVTRALAASAVNLDLSVRAKMAEHDEAFAMAKERPRSFAPYSTTLTDHVSTNTQGIYTQFEIAIPYTIPSGGKGQVIMVQATDVAADYQYITVPKFDTAAFLQAHVNDWQSLNLLPGRTSVYFENAFVGQGYMGMDQINEGMDISLGRDSRVTVERVQDKNNTGVAGFFGGSMQRTFAYTLKIRNARANALKLTIIDQLPVSRNDEITVSDLKLGGASYEQNTGELSWTMELQPGEDQAVSYAYALRYPKDTNISGL